MEVGTEDGAAKGRGRPECGQNWPCVCLERRGRKGMGEDTGDSEADCKLQFLFERLFS